MNKSLINEINRFRAMSGLPLINEQGVLDNLLSSGAKRVQTFDDVISLLNYQGKDLTDEQITNISGNLQRNGIIDYSTAKAFEDTLRSNIKLKNALTNQSANFIEEIKKLNNVPENFINLVDNAVKISPQRRTELAQEVILWQFKIPKSNINVWFNDLDTSFFNALSKLDGYNLTLHSADEFYDVVDSYINNKLILAQNNGMSKEMANEVFTIFSNKMKTDSNTSKVISLFRSKGAVSDLPKRTKSVKFGDDVNTGWFHVKKWATNSNFNELDQTQTLKTPYETADKSYLNKPNDPTFLPKDSGTPKVSVKYMDFELGATTSDFKVVKDVFPPNDVLLSEIKKIIDRRLAWLRSPEYYSRRMKLTGESTEEIDVAVEKIRKYIDEDLIIKFERDPSRTAYGVASQEPRLYRTNEVLEGGRKEILIQPQETNIQMFNSLDHEIDHIMTAVIDGGASGKANKTLLDNYKGVLNLNHPVYNTFNWIKDVFEGIKGGEIKLKRNDWTKYLNDDAEKVARLNRLNNYFKNKYNLSDQTKLTDENMDSLWAEYIDEWIPNGAPEGLEDIKFLLDEFYDKNPIKRSFFESSLKKELKNALNVTFAISALITMNSFEEKNQ
jgi:hypothetical protein